MVTIQKAIRAMVATAAVALALSANAQIKFTPLAPPLISNGVVAAWPTQNANGPTGAAQQTNYPYPGQCLADANNGGKTGLFPLLTTCTVKGSSFDWVTVTGSTLTSPSRTAGDWAVSGKLIPFTLLNPMLPNSVPPLGTTPTPRFAQKLLNPIDYWPDQAKHVGADYYEIGVHEAWGFQGLANAKLFPNPGGGRTVPNGMQWTGLVCTSSAGCSCPADASDKFKFDNCTRTDGKIPQGAPLYTPIWGVGQINMQGGPTTYVLQNIGTCSVTTNQVCIKGFTAPSPYACPVTNQVQETCNVFPKPWFTPGPAAAWSANDYVATWPSISIRATKGRPVIVKWVNEFPNNHVLCPHPEAADWPCAIDRTFMGVKARVDPGLAGGVPPDGVNQYGSPQQPDNSWVTHLHGGEIPPSTDGFAEKWFGNTDTAFAYKNLYVNPPFENPSFIALQRPAGNSDTYTYPMVQEEATIWFHDHTLGKTHHNVIAGPAGFFPVKEPAKHGGVGTGKNVCPIDPATITPTNPKGSPFLTCTTEYTWIDPVTEPRDALGVPLYDLFLAVQDRSFNDDGSINFSTGLGQVTPGVLKKGPLPIGYTPVTNGVNPQVHPVWVPEYFGDHMLVNGVLWPYNPTAPGWYRLRIVDGSDSRCYTTGFATVMPAPGAKPTNNVPFYVIANDQGYLKSPVLAPGNQFTMCPGERYELLINFGAIPGFAANTPVSVYMTNSAPAPFPAGVTPYANGSQFAEMNVIMRFDVDPKNGAGVKTCAAGKVNNWDPTWDQKTMGDNITAGTACIPANPALVTDPNFCDLRPGAVNTPLPKGCVSTPNPIPATQVVRQVYMNERADGVTLAPMGMQLNGVPFEYKVTETPKFGSREIWQFVNLTVDAHPMHPHLVAHQIVSRQNFNVGAYKALLCGSTTCQPGPAPGNEMQVVPDVTPLLAGTPVLVTAASIEGGRKDATQVPPGMVTTIIADWLPRWVGADSGTVTNVKGSPNVPPYPCGGTNLPNCPADASAYVYEAVTAGPYVWHCHINSHEDSEMMRTSLVVP